MNFTLSHSLAVIAGPKTLIETEMPIDRKFLKSLDLVPSDPRPKYARLSEAIEQAIERGEWTPGEKLPTESALAEVTPFSLGTVQRAYRQLVDSGTVERRQGAGSFVATRSPIKTDDWHLPLTTTAGEVLSPSRVKVLFRDRFEGGAEWSVPLGLTADDEIVEVDWRLDFDAEFSVLSRLFVSAATYGNQLYRPLRDLEHMSIPQLLQLGDGLPQYGIESSVQLISIPQEIAEKLGLGENSAGLYVQVTARDPDESVVFNLEHFIPYTEHKLRYTR